MRSFVQSSPARKLSVRESTPLGPSAAPPFTCAACTKATPAPPAGKCATCAGTDSGPEAGWVCEGCFTVHARGLMRNHVFNLPGAAGGASRSERELLLEQIGAVSLPPLSCRTHGGQPNAALAFYWWGEEGEDGGGDTAGSPTQRWPSTGGERVAAAPRPARGSLYPCPPLPSPCSIDDRQAMCLLCVPDHRSHSYVALPSAASSLKMHLLTLASVPTAWPPVSRGGGRMGGRGEEWPACLPSCTCLPPPAPPSQAGTLPKVDARTAAGTGSVAGAEAAEMGTGSGAAADVAAIVTALEARLTGIDAAEAAAEQQARRRRRGCGGCGGRMRRFS